MYDPLRVLGVVGLLLTAGLVLSPAMDGVALDGAVPFGVAVAEGGEEDCITINPDGTPVSVNPDECI